jgi:hypothetical protein
MNGASGNRTLSRTGLSVLAAVVAIYVSVRLIESVAVTLLEIVAVISALVIVSFFIRLVWQRHRMKRW